jgi:hypothetical protein
MTGPKRKQHPKIKENTAAVKKPAAPRQDNTAKSELTDGQLDEVSGGIPAVQRG